MNIKINPKWQLNPPATITHAGENKVDFKGSLGLVLLPKDYLKFMKISDGAVLRNRDAWFMANFSNHNMTLEIDYLSEIENVIFSASMVYNVNYASPLPAKFIVLGFCEKDEMNVLLCAEENSSDYGKIFAWRQSYDPWMKGNNTQGLGFIANNFTEFMNNLRAKENL